MLSLGEKMNFWDETFLKILPHSAEKLKQDYKLHFPEAWDQIP